MSDCFDHYMDAMEDIINGRTYDEGLSYNSSMSYDPLYYHMKIEAQILSEIGKAYLIDFKDSKFTIPKSICKRITNTTMYVHSRIFKTILKQLQPFNNEE